MPVTSYGAATPGGAAGGYSGGTGNWGSGSQPTTGQGGQGSGSTQSKPPAQVTQQPTISSQVFTVTCTGMKPNTVHKFYYEGQDLSGECIPVNPKPTVAGAIRTGTQLVTDATGKIVFKFYFTVAIEKKVDAANKTRYELAGNKLFELRATDSTANKIVPFAKPSVSIKGLLGNSGINRII